jgi:hypothetical protein
MPSAFWSKTTENARDPKRLRLDLSRIGKAGEVLILKNFDFGL